MRHTIDTPFTSALRRATAALCATVLFGALTPSNAAALEDKCSDYTPRNRPCTASEQYGYCLTNAIESYETCKEDATSVFGQVGCGIAFDFDVVGCTVSAPFTDVVVTMVKTA
jgi:hypothetical protein